MYWTKLGVTLNPVAHWIELSQKKLRNAINRYFLVFNFKQACELFPTKIALFFVDAFLYIVRSKQFNVVSTLLLGWHDIKTSGNISVEVYDVEQCRINLFYFSGVLTTSDNVETMFSISMSSFTSFLNDKAMLWIWSFAKSWKKSLELRAINHFSSSNEHFLKVNTFKVSTTASKYCSFYFPF